MSMMSQPPPSPTQVVRRKASQRKGRTEVLEHRARRPSQKRSLDRFNSILDATETLLETANIEDVSFYDIARQADLPPASVHYLFPTMSSIRIEMCERFNQQIVDMILERQSTLPGSLQTSWQDTIYVLGKFVRDHFNSHRPVCEILLGPVLHREARLANIETNDMVARISLNAMRETFVLPEMPQLERALANNAEIVDALWSRSYLRNGWIDDETLAETVEIQIANLRTLLPEKLLTRPTPAQQAPQSDSVPEEAALAQTHR